MSHSALSAAVGAAFLIVGTLPEIALAQQDDIGAAGAVGAQLSGKVMVVNTDTRLMTLKDADGQYHVLHVPPEVSRLDRIKIGDEVTITEISSVLIELQPGAAAGPISSERSTDVDRTPGSKPGGSIVDTLTLNGRVTALDKAAGTVSIEGPDGVQKFEVEDPSVLDKVRVGDGVTARFRNVIIGEVN
jgi:hypothetical protein